MSSSTPSPTPAAAPYRVWLLLNELPSGLAESVHGWLATFLQGVEAVASSDEGETASWSVRVPGFSERDGQDARLVVRATEEPSRAPELREAIKQTWDWPDAVEACMAHTATLSVEDASPAPLPGRDRVALMHGAVRGLLRGLVAGGGATGENPQQISPTTLADSPLLALHWEPSRRILEPSHYEQVVQAGDWLYGGAVNVRLYQIEGGLPQETVMDTLGLAPLGLPDLQVHFVGLDPNAVAEWLYGYAHYLFQHGDIIQDGHTVEGVNAGERWPVRHEPGLVEPERTVLNAHPNSSSPVELEQNGGANNEPSGPA